MSKLFVAVLLAAVSPLAAHAAAPTACAGTVVVDTVYQTSTGGNNFDYFFQLRNTTRSVVTATVSFAGFPRDTVSIFSPNLSNIKLNPNENERIRFAKGTSQQINNGTVQKFYDSRSSTSGATILVTGCTKQ